MKIYKYLMFILGGFVAVCFLCVPGADAHTGTPAMTVWTNGQTLTAAKLNEAFAHIHNTLSGGIANENISPTAAISLSKIESNAGMPKAMGFVGTHVSGAPATVCNDSGGPVFKCPGTTTGAEVWTSGCTSTGCYNIRLNFAPKNNGNNLVVQITSNSDGTVCFASVNPAIPSRVGVTCKLGAESGASTNAAFHFAVWEI